MQKKKNYYTKIYEALNNLKKCNSEKDLLQFDKKSFEGYLVRILGYEFIYYFKAIDKSLSDSNIVYQNTDLLKSIKIKGQKNILKFLNTFNENMHEFCLFSKSGNYKLKNLYKEDNFYLFEQISDRKEKIFPKIKIEKIEVLPAFGIIYLYSEQTEIMAKNYILLENQNYINETQKKAKDVGLYIEKNKLIYQYLNKDLFGIIMTEFNIFEPYLKRVNDVCIIDQIYEWVNEKFLLERFIGACNGHSHNKLIDSHPAILIENLSKDIKWGSLDYCSENKCNKNRCCFQCDEKDCKNRCYETLSPYIYEVKETVLETISRAKELINANYISFILSPGEIHSFKENLNYLEKKGAVDKIKKYYIEKEEKKNKVSNENKKEASKEKEVKKDEAAK
ncbi:MAG: hypothetical protein ACOCP8_02505 [archaeon]